MAANAVVNEKHDLMGEHRHKALICDNVFKFCFNFNSVFYGAVNRTTILEVLCQVWEVLGQMKQGCLLTILMWREGQ